MGFPPQKRGGPWGVPLNKKKGPPKFWGGPLGEKKGGPGWVPKGGKNKAKKAKKAKK